MDKETDTVQKSSFRPEKLDLFTKRQNSAPPFDKRNVRRSASFSGPHSANVSRCVKVWCKAKSKTHITLKLSPDKQLEEVNNDFKLRIYNAEKLQTSSDNQIRSYEFYTDSGSPINADLIFMENGQEIYTLPLKDFHQKQEHKHREIHVTVSPGEIKTPELRTYDTEKFLCERERTFLSKRKLVVKKEIKNLFLEDLQKEEVPNIALMGSGGGYRAMIAMSGVINALYDTKLLNTILYSAALSGSSWYLAVLYSHESWPNINPREVQQLLRNDVTTNHPNKWKIFTKAGWEWLKSKYFKEDWNFTSGIFGPLLGESLIPKRKDCRWSKQASKLSEGTVPLPLLAAIHENPVDATQKIYEWVEFSPYEVNFSKYGAAIKMEHFGSKFKMGYLVESETSKEIKKRTEMELPLYQIMGICGSAYAITWSEMADKQETKSKEKPKTNAYFSQNGRTETVSDRAKTTRGCAYSPCDGDEFDGNLNTSNSCYGFDEIDGIMSTSKSCDGDEFDGIMSTSTSYTCVEETDGRNMSTSNPADGEDVEHNNRNTNNTSCDGPNDQEIADLFEDLCKIREKYEDMSSPYVENGVENVDEGCDELDGFDKLLKKCKEFGNKLLLTKDRAGRAAEINNFLQNVSTTGPLESFLKFINEQEKLMFIDAGIDQNSPYPLLFQPGRDIDLILSFDFTDRHEDSNDPFKMLKKAEEWADKNNIKFPRIDTKPFEGKPVEEVYVFGDDKDINCPTILHFVLVNKGFWEFEKPGVRREQKESDRLKEFTVYSKGTYNCMEFKYSTHMFDDLANLAEYIVLNNMETIKDGVKKVIEKKRKEKRKRHFTG